MLVSVLADFTLDQNDRMRMMVYYPDSMQLFIISAYSIDL